MTFHFVLRDPFFYWEIPNNSQPHEAQVLQTTQLHLFSFPLTAMDTLATEEGARKFFESKMTRYFEK